MPSINLLPWRADLRQRRKKEFAVGMFAAVALALVIAFLAHLAVSSMIDAQNRRNELLQSEIAKLDKQIEEILSLEEQKRRMLARMEVIERLQRSRPEVVHLFDQLVRTLPEGVYLTSVKQNDRKLELSGVAQSSTRVSAFMRNIDASDTLSVPELKVIQTRSDTAPGADFTLFARLRTPEGQEDLAAPDEGKAKRVSEKRP
jgi:type IV pilus assembly protein PilN